MTKLIEVENLYFKYKGSKYNILDGVNFNLSRGEVVAIVGLSGSGKSTFLNIICGIIPYIYNGKIKGTVKIWGQKISSMRLSEISTKIGIVFQDPDTQLFSPTVEDEIAFGPENLMVDREEIGWRIKKILKVVGMEDYRYENTNNLSGGQKQLIAMASVLVMEPEILLFDEVFAQLDKEGKKRISQVLMNLKEEGKSMILVEHDYNNIKFADRIMELKDGKLQEFKGR
ncbi:energy-coupling factor ABC transporter ATP-binding protein [Anaerosalibacter massiliensis]|uniref:Energy-coupling factor ABC transporter ATP-binding protein n=1 Tax=Anaerosalibacter massiliensis TaxID=1347392 RepID=A0A9X2S707_9FIRM|nr:ABC transporter ATP-binding protein [Anaerosalibacter massiliensis]MCR2043681.1 energy-coupling factor ABC transporter ATP-binding protein [Anaerosalibacter massiliensis]